MPSNRALLAVLTLCAVSSAGGDSARQRLTQASCSYGLYLCSAAVGYGCCPVGTTCTTTSCLGGGGGGASDSGYPGGSSSGPSGVSPDVTSTGASGPPYCSFAGYSTSGRGGTTRYPGCSGFCSSASQCTSCSPSSGTVKCDSAGVLQCDCTPESAAQNTATIVGVILGTGALLGLWIYCKCCRKKASAVADSRVAYAPSAAGAPQAPGVHALVQMLRERGCTDSACAVRVCSDLQDLAADEGGRLACLSAGAVPAVTAVIAAQVHCAPAVHAACGALVNITANCAPAKAACASSVPLIAAALLAHAAADASVCLQACWALNHISSSGGREGALLQGDALSALVAAVTAQSNSEDVVRHACECFRAAAASALGEAACVKSGAIPALLLALPGHLGSAAVCAAACGALASMVREPAHKEAALAAQALPCLVAVLSAHPADADAGHWGCKALRLLAEGEAAAQAAAAAGGVAAAVGVIRSQPTSEAMSWACDALATLTSTDSSVASALAAGAAPAVMAVLRAQAGSVEVCFFACRAVAQLSQLYAGEEACVAAGAVPVLTAALRNHAGEAKVCWSAAIALRSLAWTNAAYRAAISAAGAHTLLERAQQLHPSARQAVQQVLDKLGPAPGGAGAALDEAASEGPRTVRV